MAKVICAVLRGGGDSNAASLPDTHYRVSNLLTEGSLRSRPRNPALSVSSAALTWHLSVGTAAGYDVKRPVNVLYQWAYHSFIF